MRLFSTVFAVAGMIWGHGALAQDTVDHGLFGTGEALFNENCAFCHREDGEGDPPNFPALAGNASLGDLPLIVGNVHEGQGNMPPFPDLSAEEVAAVATYPFDKKGTFEDIQAWYTQNIRYGLYEKAVPVVEPELQPEFRQAIARLKELRMSDSVLESLDINATRTRATAVVRYRGYFLSSPFEREVRVVQQWRREVPTQRWYVTPPLEALLEPPTS